MRRLAALLLAGGALLGCAPAPPAGTPARTGASAPAPRIVSLAPHLTELAFAAGAGSHVVGTVAFSDEPPAARAVPRIGDAFRLDYEAILALRPDLVLGWPSGNSRAALVRLEKLGLTVVALEPATLEDISRHLRLIGERAGTGEAAEAAADRFDWQLASLRASHAGAAPVRVFYQVSLEPLITVGGGHFISQVLMVCGGVNVFGSIGSAAATVGREDVLAASPDAIIANDYTPGSPAVAGTSPLEAWKAWPALPAVRDGLLYLVDPNLMGVPGPRLLAGAERICTDLDEARQRLGRSVSSAR